MSALVKTQDLDYLYASNTNVSNFVSIKLSGHKNYPLWKSQMLCLLDSCNMGGIVDSTFVGPKNSSIDTLRQYDSLARGWILGSVSEDILAEIHYLHSAKDIWEKLKKSLNNSEAKFVETTDKIEIVVQTEMEAKHEDTQSSKNKLKNTRRSIMKILKHEDTQSSEKKLKILKSATIKGDWSKVKSMLKEDSDLVKTVISSDGSTLLHIAVGAGHTDFVANLLRCIDSEQLHTKRKDGSTALHVAAIVGNKHAAKLLVKTDRSLLRLKDKRDKEPLEKAYEYMHFYTARYLLKAIRNKTTHLGPDEKTAIRLLVNAISAKDYTLAVEMVEHFPGYASKNEEALVALARNFPSELDYTETLIYPYPGNAVKMLRMACRATLYLFIFPLIILYEYDFTVKRNDWVRAISKISKMLITVVIITAPSMLASAFAFICLLILIVCFVFILLYFVSIKILAWKIPPIKKIENKIKAQDQAKELLELICDEIDTVGYSGTCNPLYTLPIIEAACHNAYKVVEEILFRSPESIRCVDGHGFDIIELAIFHRSEKIYNLIYDFRERKNIYRTFLDSSKNNILHLAGRLAPSSILNQRTGAALQLQWELQWYEEVKKLVIPEYRTKQNMSNKTPDMLFTEEHENLMKEAGQWMKTTSESCSITAALIITIVFAAAITVPGGSNQDKGTPLFKKEPAFIVFAISDAISLFAANTSLLVFLSILTARFTEKDFLVSLPVRLFIGLFTLLLSTAAMITAFGATLFLVFCDEKLWMLALICGLALVPIGCFVGLQFPLMLDLFTTIFLPIFGKERKGVFRKF